MGNEDEIIQRFRVEAGNSVEQLGKVDGAIKNIQTSTKALKGAHEEHGSSVEKLGKQMLGLEHNHVSLRHASHLLAEVTGINSSAVMTLSHSVGILGPAIGTAAAGFLFFKSAMESQAQAAERAKEKTDALIETVRKFNDERKAGDETAQYGSEGHKQLQEADASRAAINSLRARLKEAQTGESKDFSTKSLGGQIYEQSGKAAMGLWDAITGGNGTESDETKSQLSMQLAQMEANEKASRKQAERQKRYQDALKPAQEAMRGAELHEAEHGGSTADFKEKIDIQKVMIANMEQLRKSAETLAEKEEIGVKIDEEKLTLQHLRTEASNKYYTDRLKYENLDRPGVFATGAEKSTYAENKRFEAEKHEAIGMKKLGFDVDDKAIASRHADELQKIKLDHDTEIMSRSAAIKAQMLRNDGDNFGAEKAMADAHYNEMLAKDTGNKELLKLDAEQHNAEIAKLTIEHNNEVASYTSNLKSESLRIKGDQYGAEREALEEWQRKELEAHKDQAEQIKALHDQRAQDITRREKEEHQKILGGYAVEVTGAVLGSGAAGVQRLMQEHAEKQAEYKRTGHDDYAQAENQAYTAKINRMKLESDMELQSKNRVGFSDIGGGWESFASALNQNPMQQMQLNEQKATNAILTQISNSFRGNRAELVN